MKSTAIRYTFDSFLLKSIDRPLTSTCVCRLFFKFVIVLGFIWAIEQTFANRRFWYNDF